ncbi:MAG: hypothetical protein M0P55_01090 [Clostridiales bacterium]|nr:hypothetical protein [Clostridiales bacterium]
MKDRRVMAQDQAGLDLTGHLHRIRGDIERQQDRSHRVCRVAHLQTDGVPGFGAMGRRKTAEPAFQV